MMDTHFPEELKHTVITRFAALNSALTFLNLTHGPTTVSLDDWLTLAELVEHWAWRGLTPAPCSPAPDALPPSATPPAAPAIVAPSDALPPAAAEPSSTPPVPPPSGQSDGQRKDSATGNQIRAIFGIGKAKGYDPAELKTWVKGQFNKTIDDLTFREASKLIERLKAL